MWRRDEQQAAHALDRYLQGARVSVIAAEFKRSASTIRRWINALLQEITAEEQAARGAQLQAAIESQRAIACEAWAAYHREQLLEEKRLNGAFDHVRRRVLPAAVSARSTTGQLASALNGLPPASDGANGVEERFDRPNRANHAAVYLRLALTAQREVARLQGHYTGQPPSDGHVSITITRRPDGPENIPPAEIMPTGATAVAPPVQTVKTAQIAQPVKTAQPVQIAQPVNARVLARVKQRLTRGQLKTLRRLRIQQDPRLSHARSLTGVGP